MKTLQCREHGGTFKVIPSRGRPPVKCGGKHEKCSRADSDSTKTTTANQMERKGRTSPLGPPDEERIRAAESQPEPRKQPPANEGLNPAREAKAVLEAQGWLCKGRAWNSDKPLHIGTRSWSGFTLRLVELTATRGEELLVMLWVDGDLVKQDYSLWHEKPSANGKPQGALTFNPDECTDRELIRALAGSKVTWWNSLGQREESAVIGKDRIQIEHCYNGVGDETPGDRIVKFTEHGGAGFRAFKMAALLKVG